MAFKKISKGRKSTSEPALHLNKTTGFLNKAFCEKIGATEQGNEVSLDVMYDKNENLWAIKIHKAGETKCRVNKSHQLQLYLKTVVANVGKKYPAGTVALLKRSGKKKKLWIFELPKPIKKNDIDDDIEGAKGGKRRKKRKLRSK